MYFSIAASSSNKIMIHELQIFLHHLLFLLCFDKHAVINVFVFQFLERSLVYNQPAVSNPDCLFKIECINFEFGLCNYRFPFCKFPNQMFG